MTIIDKYLTIDKESTAIYKDKGSKFLAYAYPVETEEAINDIVAMLKKEYYDARHHCYAYRLGIDQEERYRMNDDGEPSSTAGRPIYGQILSAELTNILIVVVRYFGGTKLGVPGLIKAYKSAAAMAIEKNNIIEKIIYDIFYIFYEYQNINLAMKFIKDENIEILDNVYENASVYTKVRCPKSATSMIAKKIENIYGLEFRISI